MAVNIIDVGLNVTVAEGEVGTQQGGVGHLVATLSIGFSPVGERVNLCLRVVLLNNMYANDRLGIVLGNSFHAGITLLVEE